MTTAQLRSASGYPRTEITEGISAEGSKERKEEENI